MEYFPAVSAEVEETVDIISNCKSNSVNEKNSEGGYHLT